MKNEKTDGRNTVACNDVYQIFNKKYLPIDKNESVNSNKIETKI